MRLWGYYALHTFINTIKKIFKSKVVVVILCSMLIGGVIGGSVGFIGSLIEDQAQTEIATDDHGDAEADSVGLEDGFMEKYAAEIKESIPAATMILLLVVVLFGIYGGSKKGSDIFLMADANLLFAAPIKAQTVQCSGFRFRCWRFCLSHFIWYFRCRA